MYSKFGIESRIFQASTARFIREQAEVLFFYVVSAFFLVFSVYLQSALGVDPLSKGLVFLPCGVGFLIGPLTTPLATRTFGSRVPAIGMMLEVAGCLLLAYLVAVAPAQMTAM